MKNIEEEIEALTRRLQSAELRRNEHTKIALQLKRLRKRHKQLCVLSNRNNLSAHNQRIMQSMLDD